MGGKDDDNRSDFDRMMSDVGKEIANTKKELERVMEELRGELPKYTDAFDDFRGHEQGSDATKKGAFERFKSFVDTNFSVLSDGFRNFPGHVRDLKAKMQQEREARRAEELDIWRRWTGSDDSPDYIKLQVERASRQEKTSVTEATFLLLKESYERNRNVPPQKILNLFEDDGPGFGFLDQFATPMLSFGGACYYKSETVDNLPSTARWGWPTPTHSWLSVEWFKRSPYSPIRLEAQPGLADKGEKWRAAFEDLLLDALDKPTQTTEKVGQRMPFGKPQSTYRGPGLDWMLSLQCRGILPPQLPRFYKQYQREGPRDFSRPSIEYLMSDLSLIHHTDMAQYRRAEADIKTLMEEVGIKAQPQTDAFFRPLPARISQSSWQVPDTEEELYEQMQPQLPAQQAAASTETSEDEPWGGLVTEVKLSEIGELRELWQQILAEADDDERDELHRFAEEIMKERWEDVRERAAELGIDEKALLARGADLDEVEAELDEREFEADREHDERQERVERALARAEKLGYDFEGWDWENLSLDVLEGELKREEAYTSARRRSVLAKAAKLGYDFTGWEYEGLPVQELEDEMLRMEECAMRDAKIAKPAVVVEAKRPDVLSQLTTTETTRLPDGTVTTKVVLKRRFADGSEETKESVHTSNEVLEAQVAEKAKKGEATSSKGSGWFWK